MWTCFSSLLNYTFNFSYPLEWLYSSSFLLLMAPHIASIPHTASVPHIASTFPFWTSFHSTVSLRVASIFPFPKLAGFPLIHPTVKPTGGEIFNQRFGASLLNKNLGHTYLWGDFNTKKKDRNQQKKNEFKLIAQTAGKQPNNFRKYILRDQRWHCVLGTTKVCCKKELLEI